MADNNLSDVIRNSLEGIRSIADSSTVIGDPIPTNNGTVIIPVSKVTVGFASGGVDYMAKTSDKDGNKKPVNPNKPCFGGGGGTGVAVTPLCFLVVKTNGDVSMLNISSPAAVPPAVGTLDSITSFAEKAPDIIAKIKGLFAKKKPEDGLDDAVLNEELADLAEAMESEAEDKKAKK